MASKFEIPTKLAALTEKAPASSSSGYLGKLDAALKHLEEADKVLVALGDSMESDEAAEDALPMIDDALDKLVKVRSVVTRIRSKLP